MKITHRDELTQEHVRRILDYNPETGLLTWRSRPWLARNVDARFVGKVAGRVNKYSKGYVDIGIDGISFRAHRVIWLYVYGYMPEAVDHQDHVRDNNRLANLVASSKLENSKNGTIRSNNTSGHVGVCWHKKAGKWAVTIMEKQRQHYLGLYSDLDEAVLVRQRASEKFGFHVNHGEQKPVVYS